MSLTIYEPNHSAPHIVANSSNECDKKPSFPESTYSILNLRNGSTCQLYYSGQFVDSISSTCCRSGGNGSHYGDCYFVCHSDMNTHQWAECIYTAFRNRTAESTWQGKCGEINDTSPGAVFRVTSAGNPAHPVSVKLTAVLVIVMVFFLDFLA